MSQKNVEIIIGKLATDEEFRQQFQTDPAKTVLELKDRGFDLTPAEVSALVTTDVSALERAAESIDPRLQRASLRSSS